MADQRTTINAWLIEHGYLTALEEMADEEPLANVAEAVREIIESEAPELASADAPWLEVAAGFCWDGGAADDGKAEASDPTPRWAGVAEFFTDHPDHPGREMYQAALAAADEDRVVYSVAVITALDASRYHGHISQAEMAVFRDELQILAVRSITVAGHSFLRPVK